MSEQSPLHAKTTRLGTRTIASRLIATDALGAALVAELAGTHDRKTPYRWAKENGSITPRPEAERRLLLAYRIWATICRHDGPDSARAWFIGSNPHLGEDTPINAIRQDHHADVVAAATAYLNETP